MSPIRPGFDLSVDTHVPMHEVAEKTTRPVHASREPAHSVVTRLCASATSENFHRFHHT